MPSWRCAQGRPDHAKPLLSGGCGCCTAAAAFQAASGSACAASRCAIARADTHAAWPSKHLYHCRVNTQQTLLRCSTHCRPSWNAQRTGAAYAAAQQCRSHGPRGPCAIAISGAVRGRGILNPKCWCVAAPGARRGKRRRGRRASPRRPGWPATWARGGRSGGPAPPAPRTPPSPEPHQLCRFTVAAT
jgi:hypothetical protein